MKVKFVGFGGLGEYPCYEDEKGKVYFDTNNGRNGLCLCTGAWREKESGSICGEPYGPVSEEVECEEPFVRHHREFDYMMLGRLQADCDYFLGYGNGYEGHLYYKDVNSHCDEMKKLYESFAASDKPEWLTLEKIEGYREQMTEVLEQRRS